MTVLFALCALYIDRQAGIPPIGVKGTMFRKTDHYENTAKYQIAILKFDENDHYLNLTIPWVGHNQRLRNK